MNIERPYSPLSREPTYPASPRSRDALEKYIDELITMKVLDKVGANEILEITTLSIIAWNNKKSRTVEEFGALSK